MMDSGGFHAAASSLRQMPTEPKIAPAVRRWNGGIDFATELILCCPRFCSDFATEPSSSKQIVLCCFRFCNRTDPTSYSTVSASSPVTRNGSGEEFWQVFFTARWRGGAQPSARNPKPPKSNHARCDFAAKTGSSPDPLSLLRSTL
ncbi:hypothetical protein MRB53_003568 [Persea americana]|uniref:Uncharacterized protein n=1 Tax=Persea americana TaxID=3435 RepID=A0ACC2MXS5_PERAE|nr:hypothetical protein MRB53_003568 [Persea americana]